MHRKLIIIGASGHGKVIANIAKLNGYKDIRFLDDDLSKKNNGQYQVIGTSYDIERYMDEYDFIVAIGNNKIRKRISEQLSKMNINQTILIHPSAVIDETSKIGEGTVIMANAVINADVVIGNSCIINTAATIDHDCFLEDYVHISPGVHIAGTVEIGECTWIGVGANIINNINIVKNCVIGAGSTVIKNINEQGTYVGVPVRRVGCNE